jgi:hypothetical protein
MTPDDLDPAYIGGARVLHVSGISQAISPSCRETVLDAVRLARQEGVWVSYDPNLRRKLWPSLDDARAALNQASDKVANFAGKEPADRARLELGRDEKLRRVQDEEKRYQIAKDLSDNLTISYNTSEVVMARLQQTTNAKERVYAQSITFFSTNATVLTALKSSFTGLFGLHESTATLNAMKEGVSKSLETLSEIGDKVQVEAVTAGYGPTVRADAVKKLVHSVVNYQERAKSIIEEMRQAATKNSAEIRDAVEDGKKRMAKLVADGKALPA